MVLQPDPAAPALLHIGAAALLWLHIGGAGLGMVSGVAAVAAPKGQWLHRSAGHVFFVSMLVMTGVAAAVAPFLPEGRWTNTTAAVFTFYLVATAWATVRRPGGEVGRFEVAAFLLAAAIAAMGLVLALIYATTPRAGSFAMVFVFAAVAGLAAAFDLKVILRRGVAGAARVARHLWRMCLALAVALGSFFVGQQDVLPEAVQGSPLLFLPMLAVLGLMIFWLVRTGRARGSRPRPSAPFATPAAGALR